MPLRDLVIFALPHGILPGPNGPVGRVTAYFSPRLREDGVLADYPDWVDWPAVANGLNFQVWGGGQQFPILSRSTSSSTVWRAVFVPDTAVAHYAHDSRTQNRTVSFDGPQLEQQVRTLYQAVAEKFPDGPPSMTDLTSLPEAQDLFAAGQTAYREAIEYQSDLSEGKEADPVDVPDFHGYLGLLCSHPELQRELGIAVDLEFQLPPGGPPPNVQVRADYPFGRTVSTQTFTTGEFLAGPDPSPERNDLIAGYLRAGDPDYTTTQGNLQDFVARSRTLDVRDTAEKRDASGALPRLPSGGVILRRENQAERVRAKFARADSVAGQIETAFEGANPPTLWAEDLTNGYRYDVWDDVTNEWRSVFQRRPLGPYDLPRQPDATFTPEDDEGLHQWTLWTEAEEDVVESPGFVPGTDPETGEFRHPWQVHSGGAQRVNPTLFTWSGWSAAAPRPSDRLDVGADAAGPEEKTTTPEDQGARVSIDYAPVPGTLPRLRFGRSYRFRGRAVDMAGDSVGFDPAPVHPPVAESPAEFYGRLEPVDPPLVVRQTPKPVPGYGDATLNIVLKSDYDIPDTAVAPEFRVLFPPKVAQYLCELYGLPQGGVEPTQYEQLAERDATRIDTEASTDAISGELVWADDGPGGWKPKPSSDPVPWLSDPATLGLALGNAPGAADLLRSSWYGVWPDVRTGLLEVRAGDLAPEPNPNSDTYFRIYAPKADVRDLDLSCILTPASVELFELFADLTPAQKSSLRDRVADGLHWLFGSVQQVNLVHAVKRPLRHPSYVSAAPVHDGTQVDLQATMLLSGKSTGNVLNHVRWIERIDDGVSPQPLVELPQQRRTTSDGTGADDIDTQVINGHFDAGTTRRLDVQARGEAVSLFWRYFEEQTEIVDDGTAVVVDAEGIVDGSLVVRDVDLDEELRSGTDYRADLDAGTVEFDGRPPGLTYQVNYVPRPISRLSTEQPQGAELSVVVPSSLAPDAVPLAELVPAVRHRRRVRNNSILSERDARTFRLWLDRPWFSSGEGERLAVVTDAVRGEGTTWARDPGAPATGAGQVLDPRDFGLRNGAVQGVQGWDLALFDPALDLERNQYRVDVLVAGSTASRPWIAPVLARYQPDSMPGAALSTFHRPDPFRLGALRRTQVRRQGNGRVRVLVRGDDHDGIPDETGGLLFNDMVVTLQERDAAVDDPDLGWFDTGQIDTLARRRRGRWLSTFFLPATSATLRLVITETEPTLVDRDGSTVVERTPVFVETIELPADWVPSGNRR